MREGWSPTWAGVLPDERLPKRSVFDPCLSYRRALSPGDELGPASDAVDWGRREVSLTHRYPATGQTVDMSYGVVGGDEPEWQDLSKNRAGESPRKRAVELRQDAPIKSVLARLLGNPREERDWAVGADGEEEVAWRLRKLGGEWHVIHSVPVGEKGADIDHVVIGPGGVFTLNAKNHSRHRVTVTQGVFT
jgi:nuclease-like protein